MVIPIAPELEAILNERARQRGMSPEQLVANLLRERLMPVAPRDEWERELFSAAIDCGISVPDSAFTAEELYD